MALTMPTNALMIGFELLGTITRLMQEADGAFSGHGTGAKKKAFVMAAAREAIKTQDLISVDLMTPAQEAGVLDSFDKGVEFVFSAYEASKLFQTPEPPTV